MLEQHTAHGPYGPVYIHIGTITYNLSAERKNSMTQFMQVHCKIINKVHHGPDVSGNEKDYCCVDLYKYKINFSDPFIKLNRVHWKVPPT